jgi:hypothetical protein
MLDLCRLLTAFPAHIYKCGDLASNVAVTHHWLPSNVRSHESYNSWCRVLSEKPKVAHLVSTFPPFKEIKGLLLCSQKPTTRLYPELDTDESSPYPPCIWGNNNNTDNNCTCPMMTSDTSSGCTLALTRASLMTILPTSCALRVDNDPLYAPETVFVINFRKIWPHFVLLLTIQWQY